ncbi:MAG: DUF2993 domain-containing protein [Corynebacterium sp.]|nr:DUF2993 domain-containing protein [Corynebacterium sp.]
MSPPRPRTLIATVAVIIALAGFFLVDAVTTARGEFRLSRQLQGAVSFSGLTMWQTLAGGTVGNVQVLGTDVTVPTLGMVNTHITAYALPLTNEQVRTGNVAGTPVKTLKQQVQLDGVALGALLGISDLNIANPVNISPSGAPLPTAEFTGTPPGATEPETALVDLRIVAGDIRLESTNPAFELTIPAADMPLAAPATRIFCSGGSVFIESERHNVTLTAADLSPTLTPLRG